MKTITIFCLIVFITGFPVCSWAKTKKSIIHKNISSTYFWIGQDYGDGTIGSASAWDGNWLSHFGGTDDPLKRNGFKPADFAPKENPFYAALPYNDFGAYGRKNSAKKIPWYSVQKSMQSNYSFIKNRWIKITKNGKTAYAQVEDVGPGSSDDFEYVFGKSQPQYYFGIDVSPAIKDYLGLSGSDVVNWRFIKSKKVPNGPWKEVITKRMVSW